MFENPRRGRQARNLTTNIPKILDLKSSSEQIFSKNWRWVPLSWVLLFPLLITGKKFYIFISKYGYKMERKVLGTCKVLRLLALKQNIFIPGVFSKSNFNWKKTCTKFDTWRIKRADIWRAGRKMSALSIKQSNSELSIWPVNHAIFQEPISLRLNGIHIHLFTS